MSVPKPSGLNLLEESAKLFVIIVMFLTNILPTLFVLFLIKRKLKLIFVLFLPIIGSYPVLGEMQYQVNTWQTHISTLFNIHSVLSGSIEEGGGEQISLYCSYCLRGLYYIQYVCVQMYMYFIIMVNRYSKRSISICF